MFNKYLSTVINGECLNIEEAYSSAKMLLHGDIQTPQAAAFLAALRTRRECTEELSGFVQALYEEAITFDTDMELIDTCGTGGDGLTTFNISTVSALVVAGCGIPVAKHGNKAVTGKVGSADVLEALGVNIMLTPDEAHFLLDKTGMTFLYAPLYHPILKKVGQLRRDMGVATIFNFLGPLLNPFELKFQVMGIADARMQGAVADTLVTLGRRRALVVHAENGMDELSPVCSTRVYDMNDGNLKRYEISPYDLGIVPFPLEHIQGGDISMNTRIIREVLEGMPGPYRETVILNSAAALMTAGKAENMNEGMQVAAEAIDSGRARAILKQMIKCSRDGVLRC